MLCITIKGPSLEEARKQIEEAKAFCNLVEWRLDHFDTPDLDSLRRLKEASPIPAIFTLRPKSQGGAYAGPEEERLRIIKKLASLHPETIDLEYTVPNAFIQTLKLKYPRMRIILSYHDFEKTPPDVPSLLHNLQSKKADLYKMSFMAHSALDTLSILCLAKQAAPNVLLMTMGKTGYLSRILAPIVGSPLTYASLHDELATAPGQITASELIHTYGYPRLNTNTSLYGLIGDPVDKSIGHLTINKAMRDRDLQSVYVKIPVASEELQAFLKYAKQLGFKGLSVTMPLKEKVMEFLDEIDPDAKAIGAVNTLEFQRRSDQGL